MPNTFNKVFKHAGDIHLSQSVSLIGSIKSCWVDSEVGILISDPILSEVKIYDFNGKLIKLLGGRGEGPGEFQSPFGIFSDDKFIYITDPRLRRVSVFDKRDLKFKRQFKIDDARDIRVVGGDFFIVAPYLFKDKFYSLHIYSKNGEKLKSVLPTPDIVIKNNFISDGISIDCDDYGYIYLIHEMEYKIYKLNRNGDIVAKFYGKNEKYIAPPREPFRDFFSRERIKRWAESWTHVDRLVVLRKAGLIIVSLASFNPNKFMIDIYDLNGNLIYGGIETRYRLYCADKEDNLYFIERVEEAGGFNFIIKKYRFAGDVKK